MNAITLPKIKNITLTAYSLFSHKPNNSLDFTSGVFCLAGANGIGKSTFLNTINYALTGIVSDPDRSFLSIPEFVSDNSSYSDEYFNGRIAEMDRDLASISIELLVSTHRYKISRGLFEPNELRELHIFDDNDGSTIIDGSNLSSFERNEQYMKNISQDIGLQSFNQYIFIQHWVLSFDESRRMLLWNKPALTQALFLFIGADPVKSITADSLASEINKHGSRGRNLKFQATNIQKQINSLQKIMDLDEKLEDPADLKAKYDNLNDEIDILDEQIESRNNELNDINSIIFNKSAQFTSLSSDYTNLFTTYMDNTVSIRSHPHVAKAVDEGKCHLCGRQDENIANLIDNLVAQENVCPFCRNPIEIGSGKDLDKLDNIKNIDNKLFKVRGEIQDGHKKKDRIKSELNGLIDRKVKTQSVLHEFYSENEDAIKLALSDNQNLKVTIDKYLEQKNKFLKYSRNAYSKRDELMKEYKTLQNELEIKYYEVRNSFLPNFMKLANLFLGLHIDIRLETSTGVTSPGASIIIDMQETSRRKQHHLSESQNYFLDIALRMALSSYNSKLGACMFIDTPEGSLDIAYESRVGEMLARFANEGNDIFMTSNINSSKMLTNLASLCKSERMTLYRMTDWSELSEIQYADEKLFNDAFAIISKNLLTN